jgi:hypothetical protein
MKLQLFIVCFAVVVVRLATSMNITWGYIAPTDEHIHYEIVKKSSSIFHVVTEDVTFPPAHYFNNRTITGVRIIDQVPDNKGGHAQIYQGGPGFHHVTLHFKSQRGKSFNFILEIFAASPKKMCG